MHRSLARLSRASARALRAPAASRFAGLATTPAASLCTQADSHDDFKPQRKVPDADDSDAIHAAIDKAVKENPIFLFMKGVPDAPQCGFSMQVVRILNAHGVDFASANVLDHDGIRAGIKEYSDWPTIPQLYVNGEFVGGCDILTTMHQNGDLEEVLKQATTP